jgi:hypothetical protein
VIRDLVTVGLFYFVTRIRVVKSENSSACVTKQSRGALVRQRTIPTEGSPLVGEVSANFTG